MPEDISWDRPRAGQRSVDSLFRTLGLKSGHMRLCKSQPVAFLRTQHVRRRHPVPTAPQLSWWGADETADWPEFFRKGFEAPVGQMRSHDPGNPPPLWARLTLDPATRLEVLARPR